MFAYWEGSQVVGLVSIMDPKLTKRICWISRCASINEFALHHFDDLKSNTSMYFLESYSIWIPRQLPWGFTVQRSELQKHGCYYLGRWPNYWNSDNKKIVYAHYLMTKNYIPLGGSPVMAGEYLTGEEIKAVNSLFENFDKYAIIWYAYPENIPPEQIKTFWEGPYAVGPQIREFLSHVAFFHKESNIVEYLRHKMVFDARKLKYELCMDKYCPKPKKPQPTMVKTPVGPKPYTPDPKEPVTPPTPTAPPGPPPTGKQTKSTCTIDFGLMPKTIDNRFNIIVTITDRRG